MIHARLRAAAGSGQALAQWSTSTKGADITVDATGYIQSKDGSSGSWQAGISESGKSAGKWYWEVLYGDPNADNRSSVGFATASVSTAAYLGSDANAYAWLMAGGGGPEIRRGGATLASGLSQAANGDVLMFALDLGAGELWVGLNGVWETGDPGAGTSPIISGVVAGTWHMAASQRDTGETFELPSTSSDLAHSIPSGFEAWA